MRNEKADYFFTARGPYPVKVTVIDQTLVLSEAEFGYDWDHLIKV